MQVNKVHHSSFNKSNDRSNKNNTPSQPNFGATGNPLVAFATFIENNGFLGEFLAVDALGMATPRTIQGYNRNKEELGHPNYKAGNEELIRELLSGPAFFLVPAGVLAIAAILKGKVAKVSTDTLNAFKTVMKKTTLDAKDLKNPQGIKAKFIDSFIKNTFEDYKNETPQIDEIKKILSAAVDRKTPKKKIIKDAEEALAILNKANGKFIDNTSTVKLGKTELNITELIRDIPNYLDDFTKKAAETSDSTENFIEKFHQKANFIRRVTNVAAVSALSAFLVLIPTLYQKDKKFPGLEGLNTENRKSRQKSERSAK